MADVKQSMAKKVSGMRSQTMTFSNEGVELALSIPDTADVKEAFESVIDTVVEQHEDIGKLNENLDKVSEEGRASRKKIAAVTTDKLKQIMNYQLRLEEQLHQAQRSIRNFAYNIQGYVDESEEDAAALDKEQALKAIEVNAADISGEAGDGHALFPTEDGAVPQGHISFQAPASVAPKRTKRKSLANATIDYHAIPPFTLPAEVKARWRWAIRKTLLMIRRRKLKISVTRTRVDRTQTVAARLDALDREVAVIPTLIDNKINVAITALRTEVTAELQQLKDELAAQAQKQEEEAVKTAERFASIEEVLGGLQQQQGGKLQELEDKHEALQKQLEDEVSSLKQQLKDVFSVLVDQLERSVEGINEHVHALEKRSAKLLADVKRNAMTSQAARVDLPPLSDLLQDNVVLQNMSSQVGAVEASADAMQRSVHNLSLEASAAHKQFSENDPTKISPETLQRLGDLLHRARNFEGQISSTRENIAAMKSIMGQHHQLLQQVSAELVAQSLQTTHALPELQNDVHELQSLQKDLQRMLQNSQQERQKMEMSIQGVAEKLTAAEKVAKEQGESLEETKDHIAALLAREQQLMAQQSARPLSRGASRPISGKSRPPSGGAAKQFDDSPRERDAAADSETVLALAADMQSVKSQLDSLRETVLRQAMAAKRQKSMSMRKAPDEAQSSVKIVEPEQPPASSASTDIPKDISHSQEVAPAGPSIVTPHATETANEEVETDFDDGLSSTAMFALAFPDEKITEKVSLLLEEMLPQYLSMQAAPSPFKREPSRRALSPAQQQAQSSQQQQQQQSEPIPSARSAKLSAATQSTSQKIRGRPQSPFELRETLSRGNTQRNIFTPQASQRSVQSAAPIPGMMPSDSTSNSKLLVGSFVDYNARSNFILPGTESNESALSHFDSSPLIADIASIRSENLLLQKRLQQIESGKIDVERAKDILEGLLRDQRRRDAKTDFKTMMEDIDRTVREVVKELISVRRNHDQDVNKIREDFETALSKVIENGLHGLDGHNDSIVSTKGLCLSCGRSSNVRVEPVSRPISPSFLPQLNAHSLPGPDVYRAGFRMPVRSNSPPLSEIPIILRGRVTTAEGSRHANKDESDELYPMVSSLHQAPKNNVSFTDESIADLHIGLSEDPSCLTQHVDSIDLPLERSSAVTELPRLHSSSSSSAQIQSSSSSRVTSANKDNDTLRPIFRKGFPAKKSLKAETMYAPERFDLTLSAHTISKNPKNPKTVMSASLGAL